MSDAQRTCRAPRAFDYCGQPNPLHEARLGKTGRGFAGHIKANPPTALEGQTLYRLISR